MKKMMILAVMMVMTISARSAMPLGSSKNAMSYNAAKHEALFLSDKMAYELNLTAAQYEAVSSTHTQRYSLPTGAATAIVTLASTLDVTCRSSLCIILHLQCIAMHQLRLRITESPQQHTITVTAQTVTWQ